MFENARLNINSQKIFSYRQQYFILFILLLTLQCPMRENKAIIARAVKTDTAKEHYPKGEKIKGVISYTVKANDNVKYADTKLKKLKAAEGLQKEKDQDDDVGINNMNAVKREGLVQDPKIWDQWGKWSKCSITCGIGKITRWRHCVGGSCAFGEKEAQLKTCTFPAC